MDSFKIKVFIKTELSKQFKTIFEEQGNFSSDICACLGLNC